MKLFVIRNWDGSFLAMRWQAGDWRQYDVDLEQAIKFGSEARAEAVIAEEKLDPEDNIVVEVMQ